MELTDEHRASLGSAFGWMRRTRFGDNKKAAYTAAGVNSATWDRLEGGLPVKPQSLAKALLALLPNTEGDWSRLPWNERDGRPTISLSPQEMNPNLVGGSTQTAPGYVSGPGAKVEGGASDDAVLRAIEQMREDVRAMERRLSERLEKLEGEGP